MSDGDATDDVVALVRDVRALARRAGREDIAERITREARRVRETEVAVTVAGLKGSGKSALVNALIGRPVLPEGDATAVPTLLRAGPDAAIVHLATGPRIDSLDIEDAVRWTTDPSRDPRYLAVAVELWVDASAIPADLVVIDTPAFANGPAAAGAVVDAVSWRADAMVFVTSAAAPLATEEIEFLRTAGDTTTTIGVVVTRTDRYRGWREVSAHNLDLLGQRGPRPTPRLFATSTRLWTAAGAPTSDDHDPELAQESGVPHLRSYLVDEVIARQDDVRVANLLRYCETGLDDVESTLHRVRSSIAEGEDAAVRALRAEAEKVRLAGEEAQLQLRDGFSSLREAAANEIARQGRATAAAAKAAKSADAIDDVAAAAVEMLAAVGDEFERRSSLLVEVAEATRLGRASLPGAVADLVHFTSDHVGRGDDDADGSDPLKFRVARSAASGGVGLALTTQRLLGGGDVLSGLLAMGTLVGAAAGLLAVRSAKRSQDLAAARRTATSAIDEMRAEAAAALRQRALSRQREAEAALKQQIRLQLNEIQTELEQAAKNARADAVTRSRASAAAAAELDRIAAARGRLTALADSLST